jgi:hypothetical protein
MPERSFFDETQSMINRQILRWAWAGAVVIAIVGCGGGQKVEIPTKTDPLPKGKASSLSTDESGNPTTTKGIKNTLKTVK